MRDHTKLRAFHLADELALSIYQNTHRFPAEERFGLTSQMRRAAVSVASNIVEGCARTTEVEYVRFLEMAYGAARELEYQVTLATRLNYLNEKAVEPVSDLCSQTCKTLNGLIRSFRRA